MFDLKKFIVLGALLLATPVAAQTCPTRPVGDNSNACASTAFVQQNLSEDVTSINNSIGDSTIELTGTGSGPYTGAITIACTTATSAQIGCASFGVGLTVTSGAVTPAFGTGANQVVQGGVIAASGPVGSSTTVPVITYNAAGQLTAVTTATIASVINQAITQFRLSTTSGNPISTASGTGVGTIYAVPYNGNIIPLWNGTIFVATACPQMSNILANSATGNAGPAAAVAASVYDLVAWNNAGTCTLTRDVAWTSVTSPAAGDAFARVNGTLVNLVAITNGPAAGYGTYLGTIATDAGGATVTFNPTPAAASGGPTNGAWVGLWNVNNRVSLAEVEQDSKSTWTLTSTSAWEKSDNSANNRISFVIGSQEDAVQTAFQCWVSNYAANTSVGIGIGVNSTATPSIAAQMVYAATVGMYGNAATPSFSFIPAAGVNFIQALQYTTNSGNGYQGVALSAQMHQLSAQLRY